MLGNVVPVYYGSEQYFFEYSNMYDLELGKNKQYTITLDTYSMVMDTDLLALLKIPLQDNQLYKPFQQQRWIKM